MITYRHLPQLGIDGYPAQRMMYETLLVAPKFHRKSDDSEEWGFFPPTKSRDSLHISSVWREIEHFLLAGDLIKKPITQLYAHLQKRPFGLAEGILPVLLITALLCWEDEILLYDNGVLVTEFDTPIAERMLKRPQDYSVHGLRIAGERQAVLTSFCAGS